MDTLNHYRDLIEQILGEYACLSYAHGDIQRETVFDRERDRYVLFSVGWDGWRRVHFPVIHVDIIGGKIWIQDDRTEEGITGELVAAGIPKDQIVLAFHHPSRRQDTEFAVA